MNSNLNKKVILVCLSISSLIFGTSFAYSPKVDLQYKGGNKRHIGRYGVFMPIYGQSSNLLFTNMFFMHDSKSSLEGNFGLGFRKKITRNSILGVYGFWDIRKIKNVSQKIHQMTLGLEYMTRKFEARINGYIPQNKRFLAESLNIVNFSRTFSTTANATTQATDFGFKYEVPLPGFDVEVGGNLHKRFESFVGYYHFVGRKGAKSINGIKLRNILSVFYWLDIEGELNYDNNRKWSNYIGLKASFSFEKKKNRAIKNSIDYKMTQMTVRDLDIISNATTQLEKDEEVIQGFSPLLLSPDDVKALGSAKISGDAIFTDAADLAADIASHPAAVDLLVTMTSSSNNRPVKFSPLLQSDGTVDHVVSAKINALFTSQAQGEQILESTDKIKGALIASLDSGELDSQRTTTIGKIAIKFKAADDARAFWEENINRTLRVELVTNEFNGAVTQGRKLYDVDIFDSICRVYGRGYRPIPLVATDPKDREVGLPSDNSLNIKLHSSVLNQFPAAIKDKIISEGVNLDNVEVYSILQEVRFGDSKSALSKEPVKVRFQPNVHIDSPFKGDGINLGNSYSLKSTIKAYVMPVDGDILTPIDDGTPQLVSTHSSSVNTVFGKTIQNVWSPSNIHVPAKIYEPTNRVAEGVQPNGGAFLSLGIDPATKKAIVTYQHIANGTDADNIGFVIANSDIFKTETTLLDTLNYLRSDPIPRFPLNNNNGLFTELARFAALNNIAYDGNVFSYAG